MKTYFLVRNEIGAEREWVNLYVTDDEHDAERGHRHAVPYCIGSECNSATHSMKDIAMAILLDWLAAEEDCERKAAALSRAFANRLSRIGSGRRLTRYNATSWSLTEETVGELVAQILCDATQVDCETFVEEVCGSGRLDIQRDAARLETTPTRLLN